MRDIAGMNEQYRIPVRLVIGQKMIAARQLVLVGIEERRKIILDDQRGEDLHAIQRQRSSLSSGRM